MPIQESAHANAANNGHNHVTVAKDCPADLARNPRSHSPTASHKPPRPHPNRPILCQTEVMDKEEEHAFPDVEVPHQRRCCRFKWSSVLAFALCIIVGYHAIRYVVVSPLVQPQISFSEW